MEQNQQCLIIVDHTHYHHHCPHPKKTAPRKAVSFAAFGKPGFVQFSHRCSAAVVIIIINIIAVAVVIIIITLVPFRNVILYVVLSEICDYNYVIMQKAGVGRRGEWIS